MPAERGVPLTWPELLERRCENPDEALTVDIPEMIGEIGETNGSLYAEPFASVVAGIILCVGAERCRSALRPAVAVLRQKMSSEFRGINKKNAGRAKGFLDCINLLRCLGEPAPLSEDAWLAALAKYDKQFDEFRSQTLALAALATGQTELVPVFVGGGKLPKSFKPGQSFQFNVQGFARYIAVAINQGATAEDVQPAWEELVEVFPRKLAAETLDWVDLFWAGRAMMVHFEKRDAGEVAQALYDYVRE